MRGLRDRRVDDALRAELVEQAPRRAEHAPVDRDVLAGEEDVGVVAHALGDRLRDRRHVRQRPAR